MIPRELLCGSARRFHIGFCDIAKEGGAMVVPAFSFGVSQLYKVATGPLANFFAKLLDLSYKLGLSRGAAQPCLFRDWFRGWHYIFQ